MEWHPVEAGVQPGSPVTPILIAIYPSGLIKWVERYLSQAKRLSFVDDLSSVVTNSDVNHVISILEQCPVNSIKFTSRCGHQFNTAKTEGALFTHRRGHRKHLWAKLSAMIIVRNGTIWFNTQVTCWLGIWMKAHLRFKEYKNRCMKTPREAGVRLRILTRSDGVLPESVRAFHVVFV